MSVDLTPAKALIFRIVHRHNVPWILEHGLHCRNSSHLDPNFVEIGNPDLITKRRVRIISEPPGGTLADYVPFYFTPFSVMLYNIHTGYGGIQKQNNADIVILVSSLRSIKEKNIEFLFSDSHAYLATAIFYSDLEELDRIDWTILRNRNFQRDPDDPGKLERYQAEALVHKYMPADALRGMVCYNDSVTRTLKTEAAGRGLNLNIVTKASWYFR